MYIEISRPQAVVQYNRFIGGVDLSDRMIAHYPHAVKNKKYHMRIVFHFLNVSLINAWIQYRQKKGINIPLLEFKASVASTLLQLNQPKKPGRPSTSVPKKTKSLNRVVSEVRLDGVDHYSVKIDVPNSPRCHSRYCIRRTRCKCGKRFESVCPECMESFHKQ